MFDRDVFGSPAIPRGLDVAARVPWSGTPRGSQRKRSELEHVRSELAADGLNQESDTGSQGVVMHVWPRSNATCTLTGRRDSLAFSNGSPGRLAANRSRNRKPGWM